MAKLTNMNSGRIYIETGNSLFCCLYTNDEISAIVSLKFAISYDADICFIGTEVECGRFVRKYQAQEAEL